MGKVKKDMTEEMGSPDEWQPIKTAPKMKWVIVKSPESAHERRAYFDEPFWVTKRGKRFADILCWEPTHWKPGNGNYLYTAHKPPRRR